MINQPIFCITSDIDWASDYCIEDFLELTRSFEITPTLFATHESQVVRAFSDSNPDHLGVHPNFRSNSTHGTDYISVIDHIFQLYPSANTFRSHCFYDSSDILSEISRRGIKYDSNLCLHLQPNIVPLQMNIPNLTRFPIFWEDDWHWRQTGGDWELRHYLDAFTSPGLKIINVHPFVLSANVPSEDYYLKVKEHTKTFSHEDIDKIRYDGPGLRTFFIDLIEFLRSQNMRFHTLHELYHMFPVSSFLVSEDDTKGRASKFSDVDHTKYWQLSDADKQQFLKKEDYKQRNAKDIYATSRDFHARELEIQAITRGLSKKGSVLDLGCGNGYTLISLAKRLKDWTMVGIDFSENLIDGARFLSEKEKNELKSHPEFICADAIQYINDLKEESIDYIITERFILNLPSAEWQRKIIQKIYKILKKGGRFLMCEGSEEGFRHLNDLREQVGLRPILASSADNISAIRISDDEFEKYVQSEIGFKILRKLGMSNYFIISRILHPLMVQPLEPRFDSNFNKFAKLIQEYSEFTPGYGSNVLWIMEK